MSNSLTQSHTIADKKLLVTILVNAGVVEGVRGFDDEAQALRLHHFFLTVETIPIALLFAKAYRKQEKEDAAPYVNEDLESSTSTSTSALSNSAVSNV